MAHPLQAKFFVEFLRGDAAAALAAAEALEVLGREHGMTYWRATADLFIAWARGRLYDPAAGAAELQRARAALAEQDMRGGWFSKALLAELELRTHRVDRALARIDEALVHANQGERRSGLPWAHLLRGEILLKLDPADPGSARDAFQTAISIAQQQGARSYELLASLSLAKLHQSTGRPVEAHAPKRLLDNVRHFCEKRENGAIAWLRHISLGSRPVAERAALSAHTPWEAQSRKAGQRRMYNTFGVVSVTTDAKGVFATTLASTLAQTETVTASEGGVQETTSAAVVDDNVVVNTPFASVKPLGKPNTSPEPVLEIVTLCPAKLLWRIARCITRARTRPRSAMCWARRCWRCLPGTSAMRISRRCAATKFFPSFSA